MYFEIILNFFKDINTLFKNNVSYKFFLLKMIIITYLTNKSNVIIIQRIGILKLQTRLSLPTIIQITKSEFQDKNSLTLRVGLMFLYRYTIQKDGGVI